MHIWLAKETEGVWSKQYLSMLRTNALHFFFWWWWSWYKKSIYLFLILHYCVKCLSEIHIHFCCCADGPVSEMTYTVSSGTLNSSIPLCWWMLLNVCTLSFLGSKACWWVNQDVACLSPVCGHYYQQGSFDDAQVTYTVTCRFYFLHSWA